MSEIIYLIIPMLRFHKFVYFNNQLWFWCCFLGATIQAMCCFNFYNICFVTNPKQMILSLQTLGTIQATTIVIKINMNGISSYTTNRLWERHKKQWKNRTWKSKSTITKSKTERTLKGCVYSFITWMLTF
jgi:hypothetical protein